MVSLDDIDYRSRIHLLFILVFDLQKHLTGGVYLFFGIPLRISKANKNYMDQTRSNQPNAAKLISSLRNTGYDSYSAIADIVDNSIDAEARTIKIFVEQKDKKISIIIADDGIGMDEAILDEALKLGSKTDRDEVSDLGKYGMGLCTASISMAKKLEVITKKKDEKILFSSQDLDVVVERNEFVKILREANVKEEEFFKKMLKGGSGTVVVISNVDRLSDTNYSQFSATLSKQLGRIYRKFLEVGIEIFVNDKKIIKSDPLFSENKETKIYSDELYELPPSAINGKKESIRVKIVILPLYNEQLESEYKMNITNQGFYVMRNNREVAKSITMGLFTKHNSLNRLRMELSFNATLDNEMGVRFTKDGVSPNQAIMDFIKQEIGGQIASISISLKKEKASSPAMVVDHAGSEQVIAQRAKLLITPEAVVEKRGPREKHEDVDASGVADKPKDRVNFREVKTSPKGMGARFESVSHGREGVLYECYQEGKIIVIQWNTDHPFYDQVILANKDSKAIISALDYLVFAFASAEMKTQNDDNVELMANIKSIMSTNLRALLS